MKPTKLGFFIGALGVFCLTVAAQAAPSTSPTTSSSSTVSTAIASADAAVAAAEQSLAKANTAYKAGVGSEMDLQSAQIALEQARIQAALAHQNFDGLSESLQKIIAGSQAQIAQMQKLFAAGVVDQRAVIDAQSALAKAKLQADLYSMINLDQEKLADTQRLFQVGVAAQADLEKAQAELKKAQDAFHAAQP